MGKPDVPTSVYVITSGPFVKVGISRNPERRAIDLRTSTPEGASVFFTRRFADEASARKVERRAHALLQAYRKSGEWFYCSPERARITVSRIKVDATSLLPRRREPPPMKVFGPADSIDEVLREIAREKIRKAMGWEGDFPVHI